MNCASSLAMRFSLTLALLCAAAHAQQPQDAAAKQQPQDAAIKTTVNVVLAPTTVTDRDGNFITGLKVSDFQLFDNEKPQILTQDVSVHPLSIVVAVQANNAVTESLPKIVKMGSVIGDLVVGDNGEGALIEFDHRIRTVQDFTTNSAQFSDAMKKIKPGSSVSAMIDAVAEGIRMLKSRPPERRRVILLISETRDYGSENHVKEVLTQAQFANVTIYSVNISHLITALTRPGPGPAPNPIPTAATAVPHGAPLSPTSISTNRDLGSFIPAIEEIFKGTVGLFVADPMDVFTRATGGREFSFIKQDTLEHNLIQLGQELHNQYLLSYHPSNFNEPGYHHIQVVVNRAGLSIRTRPGYWSAGQ